MNNCIDCGKKISEKSRRCMSCANLGILNPYYKKGLYLSTKIKKCKECKKKLSLTNISGLCTSCTKKGKRNNLWKGGLPKCIKCNRNLSRRKSKVYHPKFCWKCFIEQRKGKNNPNYIDGRTTLMTKIRHLDKYVNWRNLIYKKDRYTCQICFSRNKKRINAHHKILLTTIVRLFNIKTIKQALNCKLLWDINWGITLCSECHNYVDLSE